MSSCRCKLRIPCLRCLQRMQSIFPSEPFKKYYLDYLIIGQINATYKLQTICQFLWEILRKEKKIRLRTTFLSFFTVYLRYLLQIHEKRALLLKQAPLMFVSSSKMKEVYFNIQQYQQNQMYSLIKKRTINQIIASRKTKRSIKQHIFSPTMVPSQWGNQFKMDLFLKKTIFNNEDKILLLRHLQKKYRFRFDQAFNINCVNWLVVRQKKILDKQYDSSKKSYYLLKGHVSICQKAVSSGNFLRQSQDSDNKVIHRYEECLSYEGEKGIGELFDAGIDRRVLVMAENALILEIAHEENQLEFYVEKNCVMTTEQKQGFIKNFTLFKKLDNINKYYTPFFRARKYFKGDLIYEVESEAQYFYLIVDGQIQFSTKIVYQNPELQQCPQISSLILKNTRESFILITTEILGKENYFGEEEILSQTLRKQNAKCLSLYCVLMEIPLERLNKLLFYNQFKDILQNSANSKQSQRSKKISNFLLYRKNPSQLQNPSQKKMQPSINFNDFNEAIYLSCSIKNDSTRYNNKKISLRNTKTKILHGSALKISSNSKVRNQSFSMLKVNNQMYQSSMKKFRSFSVQQKKRKKKLEKGKVEEREGRSLHQIWKVLKLQNVIQDEEKLSIENGEGKHFFNAHLRLMKHLKDVKSYRPKTTSSNCRVKTEYVQYLQTVL